MPHNWTYDRFKGSGIGQYYAVAGMCERCNLYCARGGLGSEWWYARPTFWSYTRYDKDPGCK